MAKIINNNRVKGLSNGRELMEHYGDMFLYVRKSDTELGLVQGYCYRVSHTDNACIVLYPNSLNSPGKVIPNFSGDSNEFFVKVGFM